MMNERIKELDEQAKAFARESVEYSRTEGFEIFTEKLYEVSREKFAELIVRECVWIGYNHCATHKSQDEYKFTDSLDRIKEHFGVE